MAGYRIKFLIAPAQPLPGFTMMGLCAVAPVLIGPNPMRILGLIACALAGYLFCPEYRETKKLPARLAVRESLYLFDPLKAAAAAHVAKEKRLPQEGELTFKLPENDKAAVEAMAGGGFIARLKFASLEGRSVRLMPMLANEKLTWQCVSDDVEPSYLPAQCRNAENLRRAAAAAAASPTKVKQAK